MTRSSEHYFSVRSPCQPHHTGEGPSIRTLIRGRYPVAGLVGDEDHWVPAFAGTTVQGQMTLDRFILFLNSSQ